ncbi:MAG: hypothetical protein KAS16_04845 [Thermoplasmata archaeon]|nr:hypothetical protein [Thermoplasmata archaeon]
MRKISLERRKQMCQKMLILHPPVCPVCKEKAMPGFMAGAYPKYVPIGKKRPFVDPLLSNFDFGLSTGEAAPAYICKGCNLVFGMSRPMDKSKYNIVRDSLAGGKLSACSYCSSQLESGYVWSSRGMVWCEGFRGGLRRRIVLLVPIFGVRFKTYGLATKRCRNCGMFYSRYHPDKVKKVSIFWIVTFIIIFAIVFVLIDYLPHP